MNIVFISSWYPTAKNPNFGIFIKEHANSIHSVGNNIIVIAVLVSKSKKLLSTSTINFTDENNIPTTIIEINSYFKELIYYAIPFQYFFLRKTVNKLLKQGFKADIIHSNVIFPAGIMANWLANSFKIPHIITEHWSRIEGFMKKPILARWGKNAYRNSAMILPVSNFLKNRIAKLLPSLTPDKFKIVGNVIDSETFFYTEKSRKKNSLTFCAIATWTKKKIPDKLPELFIEALALLQKETALDIKLKMVGGGDKIEELKSLCNNYNLAVEFTGFIEKKEIATCLQNADFLIHASTVETFGVVIAEALMCGTPVICSNVGALPEIINSSNGILCNNNVSSWISGLKDLIKLEFSNKKISEDIKKEYDVKSIGSNINLIYNSLIPKVEKE